ncbi:hypothetical protein GYMLUDRAFT_43020 [Collybiopsis luxurians FD-317 M1]|uniref:Uncharacterized protein n=1 Tax=Collybiopsis luxurians FD-317 M1 TaxID=944289 RepID=A0A0D0CFV2_9AGAR|nr:hypothetical protein GYMLUDRAFT_43020 [Collybiopsis luxurians FD-317 M1]
MGIRVFRRKQEEWVIPEIDCVDISDKQFPKNYPPNIRLNLRSATALPAEWKSRFSYAHQRLLVSAVDHSV